MSHFYSHVSYKINNQRVVWKKGDRKDTNGHCNRWNISDIITIICPMIIKISIQNVSYDISYSAHIPIEFPTGIFWIWYWIWLNIEISGEMQWLYPSIIFLVVSWNGGPPNWLVYNGTSDENGWFGGSPMYIYIYTYIQYISQFNIPMISLFMGPLKI